MSPLGKKERKILAGFFPLFLSLFKCREIYYHRCACMYCLHIHLWCALCHCRMYFINHNTVLSRPVHNCCSPTSKGVVYIFVIRLAEFWRTISFLTGWSCPIVPHLSLLFRHKEGFTTALLLNQHGTKYIYQSIFFIIFFLLLIRPLCHFLLKLRMHSNLIGIFFERRHFIGRKKDVVAKKSKSFLFHLVQPTELYLLEPRRCSQQTDSLLSHTEKGRRIEGDAPLPPYNNQWPFDLKLALPFSIGSTKPTPPTSPQLWNMYTHIHV